MCIWQSQAFSGALSFGGSVPVEFDTGWAWLCRPIVEAVAAIATMEAFLMNVRREVIVDLPDSVKDGAPGARPSRRAGSRAAYSAIISPQGGTMNKTIVSHAVFGGATALLASFVTYWVLTPDSLWLSQAYAQTPAANAPARQTELFKTTMSDVLGRE